MKRVCISGGSRGIGRACVERFCADGYAVAFLYRQNNEAAREVAEKTGAAAIRADVSDPEDARNAIKKAEEALGGSVDILVSNAGISWIGQMQDMTDAEWRRLIDTNLSGAFYLAQAVAPAMIHRHSGRIIFVGSMWGKTGASCEVAYSASKAGLRGLTMSMAKELGLSGITVNCVEPGVIDTEMNACLDEETRRALCDETPVGRIGTPDEIAHAVRFFAADESSFITGQILGVDGGMAI